MITHQGSYNYVILYTMPQNLIESNALLALQWKNIENLIPCLLKSLYTGTVDVKIHDLDRIFTGIINLDKRNVKSNILGKVASLWYYLTKIFHQSMGPREGNFVEELITNWIKSSGDYPEVYRNATLATILKNLVRMEIKDRSKIDFTFKSKDGRTVAFVELRMSEHTGGRTAQESLLDKIVKILKMLEHPQYRLREKLVRKGIHQLDLSIAILFNEQHELLNTKNYNRGRLTSLVNYIMEERHIWGALKDLLENHGYRLCREDNSTVIGGSQDISIIEKSIMNALLNDKIRSVCIESSDSNLRIRLNILFGNEFFERYAGLSFNDLLTKYGEVIADDVWLYYTLTINELKIAQQFGHTNVRKVYEILRKSELIKNFLSEVYEYKKITLKDYIIRFNSYIEECTSTVLKQISKKGEELRLLETNDIIANYEYLKQVCIGALSIAIHIEKKLDSGFKLCRWED